MPKLESLIEIRPLPGFLSWKEPHTEVTRNGTRKSDTRRKALIEIAAEYARRASLEHIADDLDARAALNSFSRMIT